MAGTQGRFRRSACAYNLLQSSLPLGPARRWPPSNQPYHPPLGWGCIRRLPCTFPPDRVAHMLKPYHSTGGVGYGLRGVFGMAWFRFLKNEKKKKKKISLERKNVGPVGMGLSFNETAIRGWSHTGRGPG
jgi:hypothetical protein